MTCVPGYEVYIPRIQRGDASFAAKILGAKGALLGVLAHFFECGRWGSLIETGVEDQNLAANDQVFVLMQSALNLAATWDSSPDARVCYEHMESLCRPLNRPRLQYLALVGQWHHSLATDTMMATMAIAKRIYSLAKEQNDSALTMGAYRALADSSAWAISRTPAPFGATMQHVHGDPFNASTIPAVSSQFLRELFDSVTTSAFGDIE